MKNENMEVRERRAGEPFPVLFVIFQTENRANGGVESITQVLEHLRGVRPVIVTQRRTAANERWRRAGADVRVWDLNSYTQDDSAVRFGRQAHAILKANARAFRLVRSSGAQVVHCNDIRALWHAGWGARAAGTPVVFNVRDTFAPERAYGWKWKLARLLSQRVLVLSAEMRAALARRLTTPLQGVARAAAQTDFIYSIVDLEQMSPVGNTERRALREDLSLSERELALGYIATVNDKKNQLQFIEEAGPLLQERLPAATIYFVGDFDPEQDAYARRCWNAVRRLGLSDTFSFVGYADRVERWYQAVDFVVLASRREGMARCMIEGLACGAPVVSFDVCSAREILEGYDCGLVTAQGDYEALVRNVGTLASDAECRRQMGGKGREAAQQLFDARRNAQQYRELYQEISQTAKAK